ncbi:MAG: hypothetical protein RJQ00_08300 [Vicingaceae bacterium]
MKKNRTTFRDYFNRTVYFFPLQLLFVHLKKNQQLLIFWLILFLVIFKELGLKYGIPYLFLAPEYLGKLSFSSYFIVGFSLGGFVSAFNISSYIMNGFRFPFLATLSKPFLKYSINNATIPLLFIICYLLQTHDFLKANEIFNDQEIAYRLLGFLGGYVIFTLLSMAYFLATNKDFEKLFGKELAKVLSSDSKKNEPATILLNKNEPIWFKKNDNEKSWRVDTYLSSTFGFRKTRPHYHYDESMLSQVFRQNHINASFFEIGVIISIIILGLFREKEVFIIPAGASIVLLFTMLLMFTSALRSWIRGWTLIVILAVILLINQLSKLDNFYYDSLAYGMSYDYKVPYPEKHGDVPPEKIQADYMQTIRMLESWKKKQHSDRPKAVFLAASGGGARAAQWSFLALQHLDSLTKGQLMNQVIMGTGSSGGMIGTAYFRELKWKQQKSNFNPYSDSLQGDMSKDMLNPIIFNLAVNDVLIRTQKFDYEGTMHWKDRAYVFEKTLNRHSNGFFQESLGDYAKAEQKAEIPSLIFTPSVVNDGRRMLVSTMPLSFITQNPTNVLSENIDYMNFFKHNDPLNLRFTTLLRMNSSFPYIMPTISMPTDPTIDVFDSGLRDNYGIKTTIQYIFHIRNWLAKNTSGIVILQIRDGLKIDGKAEENKSRSIVNEILTPFGSLYGNWFEVQDYNNDELLEYTSEWYKGKVDIINYQLNKSADNYISLSWHLTSKEKVQIINSLTLEENIIAQKRLKTLLNE